MLQNNYQEETFAEEDVMELIDDECAIIVHFKGKCDVKTGSYEYLEPLCTALLDAGLSAQIEN